MGVSRLNPIWSILGDRICLCDAFLQARNIYNNCYLGNKRREKERIVKPKWQWERERRAARQKINDVNCLSSSCPCYSIICSRRRCVIGKRIPMLALKWCEIRLFPPAANCISPTVMHAKCNYNPRVERYGFMDFCLWGMPLVLFPFRSIHLQSGFIKTVSPLPLIIFTMCLLCISSLELCFASACPLGRDMLRWFASRLSLGVIIGTSLARTQM